ncbi:dTDP-4-dehydrorhamnose reductase [Azospirillum halopraeferens]|uniref:dTDP-4-dehydrorhamnose reductase n=1 Tax=Azospirillum halopraeferens TaxID=34010 RepID=UPI000415575C|nr:dTDP-4-dehydrorhamnose reductase [Azospirillum halopraeferens]
MIAPNRTSTILVIGAQGQVARELARAVLPPGFALHTVGRPGLDVSDRAAVRECVLGSGAAAVVNAAAYTAVDRAESEPEMAFAVNAAGPGHLAAATAEAGLPLIHLSTDYVFDGTRQGPYREDDPVAPLGVYGASKEAGERAVREGNPHHVILRTAWVHSPFGANFVRTMLRLGAERDELRVVADQRGCPTAAGDLAAAIVEIVRQLVADRRDDAWGTYHLAGTGETTWHGFAEAIFARAAPRLGRHPVVHAITTAEYPTPARRPANSVLDCALAGRRFGVALRPWPEALAAVVDELLPAT